LKNLSLAGTLAFVLTAHLCAQPLQSMRASGDITLFGNPDCVHWLQVEPKAKEVWLNAILSPINMAYVRREKAVKDKFSALTSLAPALKYVDNYCENNRELKAMSGAIKYFEMLNSLGD
jgi:hypothetical protein